jgi:uncharacterized membrane protein
MIEILFLVIVVAGLAAQRKTSARLLQLEIEVETLKADLLARPPATAADLATAASTETLPGAIPTATLPIEDGLDEGPWAKAQRDAASAPAEATVGEERADDGVLEPLSAESGSRGESFESWLGARWAVWVGGLALALGGIFLVKYSIESGLLSPAVRLMFACLFGLALIACGELVRRRGGMPALAGRFEDAMIPGILTAAGAVTLFGAIYAAHGIYGFIGAATAFAALGVVALATLGLSLQHGQALAGLGLLGSIVTPALVASTAPNIWALFGFLTITWLATALASRLKRWLTVPALASLGLGLWAIFYLEVGTVIDLTPPTLALLVMIAGSLLIWPGRDDDDEKPAPVSPAAVSDPSVSLAADAAANRFHPWLHLLCRPPLALTVSLSVATLFPALLMLGLPDAGGGDVRLAFGAIVAALAAFGATRAYAVWPAILSAAAAIGGVGLMAQLQVSPIWTTLPSGPAVTISRVNYNGEIAVGLGLGALFVLFGIVFIDQKGRRQPHFAALWSLLMALVPVSIAAISFVNFGRLDRDWLHGGYAIATGLILLAIAEWLFRRSAANANTGAGAGGNSPPEDRWPVDLLVAGSFAGFAVGLHALTSGLATTVLLSVIGIAYVAATRIRNWAALPWMMVAAILLVLGRIGWQPSIVGPEHLEKTPVFNALLAGYGIPALLTVAAAYLLRGWPGVRVRNALQALASLMVLLTLAILVRHAMNGGVLDDAVPTLGEQSIYTLLLIGLSGTLMTLDLKSPGPVFRLGSMLAGGLSMIAVLIAHFIVLNPYFTGESTGAWPFVNLLLLGYLLPGLAYAGLAWYAQGKRPPFYVALLALCGAVLGFAWATLSVRRFWQGADISSWKGFLQGETYSYSVVWLAIGVGMLALGSRFQARSLRLGSAGLVLIAVIKVFVIDMANLEGILRALSFIGLGAVLIGIGLFYQKVLAGSAKAPPAAAKPVDQGPDKPQ